MAVGTVASRQIILMQQILQLLSTGAMAGKYFNNWKYGHTVSVRCWTGTFAFMVD